MSESCCCGAGCCAAKERWMTGEVAAPNGPVPVISTKPGFKDALGAWKARWGIGRMSYTVNPGLYAVGRPDETSHVLVSANYKLTFDVLRRCLAGLNLWLLILDTKGVNVWCAAGKGTFGTDELVSRMEKTGLYGIVSHRTLILPQLGAPGVCAHEVERQTGFSVVYGPVRAKDLGAFLEAGLTATRKMRAVSFSLWDRLVLTPVELTHAAKTSLMIFGVLFLLNLFARRPFGGADFALYAGAVLTGTVLTPALLPFIPGRAFACKGWILGFLWTAGFLYLRGWLAPGSLLLALGYLLVLPSFSAFLAMNFTGSSTYTSFSGVVREMKGALPFIVVSSALGILLVLFASLF